MPEESIEALPSAQLECLSLAAKGMTSKQIARATGYSPGTIDTYLSRAAQALGAGSRREAVLLFKRWEGQQSGKAGFPQPIAARWIDPLPNPANTLFPEAGESAGVLRERLADMGSLPPIGGQENDLSSEGRLAAALKIAFFSALVLVAIALILREGLRAFS